jgi:hypothetical protein
MGDDSGQDGQAAALAMIDTFASVGTTRFDVTLTSRAGTKEWFRGGIPLADLRRELPGMLTAAAKCERNVIMRPHGTKRAYIQLDDLKADQLILLAPAVFLALETSPGNFQAWVALAGGEDRDFARRLRKGTGADATASGATRVAGSLNFKDKYAPHFPYVALHRANPGRLATTAELDRLGLVAPPDPERTVRPAARSRHGASVRKWPSYERCLERAPPSQGSPGENRHSIADFTWCLIAADWGWPVEEIAVRLLEESAKARDNGHAYALKTATRAAEAADRNAAKIAERRQAKPRPLEYGRR